MAAILPSAMTQFTDGDGNPYAMGNVYFYIPNTLTPKDTYQNLAATILNTNPVQLDADGRAYIVGIGRYRQILEDSLGNQIWDKETIAPGSSIEPFASVAALMAYSVTAIPDGTVAEIVSYAGDNNGGGGPVVWRASSSTAHNGVTVYKPTAVSGNGRWHRIYSGPICADWGGFVSGTATPMAALQAVVDALPSTGGVIDARRVEGSLSAETSLTINKKVRILLGGVTIALNAYNIGATVSGCSIKGISKQDENNSATRFTYGGTGEAFTLKNPTISTPLFGIELEDLEVSAVGSAASSATAKAIASYGTRYCVFRNVEVFNFQQGVALYFTGNGGGLGFGATNQIYNPALSTNKYAILADTAGGSASTMGEVYGGYAFGSTTGFDSNCESWRIYSTDMGGNPCIKLRTSAHDTAIIAARFEAFLSAIVIDGGNVRSQIIAPAFINTAAGIEITDNGSDTIIIAASASGANYVDSKVKGLKAALNYQFKGVTAQIAGGAFEDIKDLASNGGTWILGVRQSDGGTGWRACAIIFNSGAALTVSTITSANVTVGSSGTSIRLTNTSGSPQALQWSLLKFEGNASF